MTKVFTILGVVLILMGLSYHFAALEIFNFLVPKDAGSKQIAQDVAYGSETRQKLDIYAPTAAKGPWPVVVFVHGGSWQEGNKNPYAFVGRALAAQGFLALVINYRLHPKDRYPAFVDDTALALQWAAQHATEHGGNATQLFAMGHSAGAYNVAQAVLTRNVPKLKGVITLSGPFDFLPLDSPITKEVFRDIADLPDTQPINHVRADAPQFLILHGSEDKTVFLKNPRALDAALKRVGVQSILKIYDGVSHAGIMLALSIWQRSNAPVLEDVTTFIHDAVAQP
jgi:acetyl esterase/lipase